jgi:hypothetical protein
MPHNQHCRRQIGRQAGHQLFERLECACRPTDHNYVTPWQRVSL